MEIQENADKDEHPGNSFRTKAITILELVSRNGIPKTKGRYIFKAFIKNKESTYYQDAPEEGCSNSYSSINKTKMPIFLNLC